MAEMFFAGEFVPGNALTLWGPTGEFVLEEGERPLAFVACDIGFGPLKSLIEHAMAVDAAESMSLDWLATRPDGHYLGNQCRAWAAAFDGFRYAPHTAADAVAGAQALVASMAADLSLPRHDVYVAGPAAFVDAAGTALTAAGVPQPRLRTNVV
jgi:NAD(P)H-flavin reductase